MAEKKFEQNLLDRAISYFNPKASLERNQARFLSSMIGEQGYDIPSSGRRYMRGINVSPNSPDADYLEKQESVVALSRDLYMNTPLATSAIRRTRTNVIGSGLKLQSQINFEFLGLTKEEARVWGANTEEEFNLWANSKSCDITEHQNFYELQDLMFNTVLTSGDIFVTYPYIESVDTPYKTKIRVIEGDLCKTPIDKEWKNQVKNGIHFDNNGKPKNYYFSNLYSGENFGLNIVEKFTQIPAYDKFGRKQVFHLFFKERPGQSRGVPFLAPIVNMLKQHSKLLESELTAHVVNSFFTVFIRTSKGYNGGLENSFGSDNSSFIKGAQNTSDDVKYQYEMGSGNIIELDDDKDVTLADPRKVSNSFHEFVNLFAKQIGSAVDLPIEQLLMNFSSSYSASRGALLEAWKSARTKRSWASSNFCQISYEKWLEEAVSIGRISAPGFFEDPVIRKAWSKAVWGGMGNGQLDPIKETKASILKINNSLSNYEKEYNLINDDADWDGNTTQLAFERSFLEKNKIVVSNDDSNSLPKEKEKEKEKPKNIHQDDKGRI
jgi:lambda family phage portal protein